MYYIYSLYSFDKTFKCTYQLINARGYGFGFLFYNS